MKLTTKLILAFLAVSLFSTGIIVISSRIATNREFDKFINDRYEEELLDQLSEHFAKKQSWDGVEKIYQRDHFNPNDKHPLFFAIADENGNIIVEGDGYLLGESVSESQLQAGSQIEVDDQMVGILLLKAPLDKNPLEDEFIRRIGNSIFLSAVGTILLAFILGAILSRTITRPIRELTKATHEMADGKLGQQVPVRSCDEIGELASSFNKMNSDLARSFNLRKQMTADIAHELRTPLALIIGHAEGVHDGVLPPSKENFEIIREEAERLEKLVNDLRTLSLADAGELSVEFQPVEIHKFLSDIQSHYLAPFNQKRITLNLMPAPVLLVNLDPSRFSQVLTNILDNALRFTPEGGRVDMSIRQSGDLIEISIQDSGEGVTAEDAAHLFDRFYRADESRNRDAGGSGLGLAIAKSIVEMHKGKIWAESETGKGLKVIIQIPVAK